MQARWTLTHYLESARHNRLVRQNAILFAGGLLTAFGGFVYHAIAGRSLGPDLYGQLVFLTSIWVVGAAPAVILSLILAQSSAILMASGHGVGVNPLVAGTMRLVSVCGLLIIVAGGLLAPVLVRVGHLGSALPVFVLGLSVALVWLVAIPRGILQGLQRFTALSLNQSLELVVRCAGAFGLLAAGYSVAGAMTAVSAGLAASLLVGLYSLRRGLVEMIGPSIVRAGSAMPLAGIASGSSITAAVGIIGVQVLYNQDVILGEHFLSSHEAGIYGAVNKIAAVLFILSLSVSQVMYPRLIEAMGRPRDIRHILLTSVAITVVLCASGLGLFILAPGLVVNLMFGPTFQEATRYVLLAGAVGLTLSLDNLLVQFLMGTRDRSFIPLLVSACIGEATLIIEFHSSVGAILAGVLLSLIALFALLLWRCFLSLSHTQPTRSNESAC